MEQGDFKQHLYYLKSKTYKNQIDAYIIGNRYSDNYAINTVSGLAYTRKANNNIYTGRISYAGRDAGKGFQLQGEWERSWDPKTRTHMDAAWANKFFPKLMVNASLFRSIAALKETEIEIGAGYRQLSDTDNLSNIVVGLTKETDLFRLNTRFNNFILNGKWLYNLSANARYYLSSPKNYLTAMASIGSSPDVELINYQLYNGFSVLNTMAGAGITHMFTKSVWGEITGNWYNYKAGENLYKNLYTINLSFDVLF